MAGRGTFVGLDADDEQHGPQKREQRGSTSGVRQLACQMHLAKPVDPAELVIAVAVRTPGVSFAQGAGRSGRT
jgi:hypothetical protein